MSILNADALLNQAYAAQGAKDFARAAKLYDQVIALAPGRPEAYVNLGELRKNAGDLAGAETLFRKAIAAAPKSPIAHLNLGVVHVLRREEDAAMAAFQRALKLQPDLPQALFNLAGVFERLSRLEDAARTLDRLVVVQPTDIAINSARAQVLFMLGRWKDAWASYHWRHAMFWGAGRKLPGRLWRGEDATGKTVLLSYEQGLGEQIMFASMIPDIARTAKHVIVECETRLVGLFQRSFPEVEVVPWRTEWHPRVRADDIDFHAGLGDPGLWLRDSFESFPAHAGYLHADTARAAALRAGYETIANGRRIMGLVWHSAAVPFGPQKSIPPERLAPLLARPDILWINLQHGPAREAVGAPLIADAAVDPTQDLSGLAAQIAALDGVVGISSATAHLAGALGKPATLLLPKVLGRHWYWFPDRAENPWYPSIQAFAQTRDGVWDDVIARVAAAL